ncbi:MAG: YcbK family protein [Bacillota bacterium]
MNRIKLSKNFSLHEFECKDGSHLVKVDEELLDKLQKLRDMLGKPVIVVSGYRTPEYNQKVGGATKSLHLEGKAADIKVSGITPKKLAEYAEKIGFRGIGIYASFVHVDIRVTPAKWVS